MLAREFISPNWVLKRLFTYAIEIVHFQVRDATRPNL